MLKTLNTEPCCHKNMESTDNRAHQDRSISRLNLNQPTARTVPILLIPDNQASNLSSEELVEVTPSTMMAPPARMSPENETNETHDQVSIGDQTQACQITGPNAAAAGGQQPKVVQTAFIHKLYNMLEDQSIQHLISWSNSAESFVMSPSTDFAKVLSQYFKHTNISSFVRQLNMYGFHKVSDVFHTGSPESPLWEFKHGNGNFKRGDLVGLREIKRRASRHALVHRDSYPGLKPPLPQPGSSVESIHPQQLPFHEPTETRLSNLENTTCEMHALLQRIEENSQVLRVKNQVMMEALSRSLKLNQEMSKVLLSIIPNPEMLAHRDVVNMQSEIQKHVELIRSLDEPSETRPYLSTILVENGPVSPRQTSKGDVRRGQTPSIQPWQSYNRSSAHAPLSTSSRRYDPAGTNNVQSSPSNSRLQPPLQPLLPHSLTNPLSIPSPPTSISRRHTSADIRNVQGWQTSSTLNCPGQNIPRWTSSPKRNLAGMNEEQHIHESFSSYSITNASSHFYPENSRPTTPPLSSNGSSADHLNSWSWTSGNKCTTSGPPTRRGSMAHILNPADTSENHGEHDETQREDDRKRKRIN
ncbi:hypothetical protein GcC1_060004 [Golovinomyces cichoracearum]|uniref:HSF-type DNA-binding domain-containing protein n=1 Tax=Golovinomyces cichoracearum TaxID=62708 RepID=A0A420ITF8_9PEZI|nr:hypothetical protein GcC1_060004 [Golovinomyces cichoracearum]